MDPINNIIDSLIGSIERRFPAEDDHLHMSSDSMRQTLRPYHDKNGQLKELHAMCIRYLTVVAMLATTYCPATSAEADGTVDASTPMTRTNSEESAHTLVDEALEDFSYSVQVSGELHRERRIRDVEKRLAEMARKSAILEKYRRVLMRETSNPIQCLGDLRKRRFFLPVE